MSAHEWCRDVSRDEAVRAAEDAANWRLLEMGEVIEEGDEYESQVFKRWERVPKLCVGKPIDSYLPHRRRRAPSIQHRDLPEQVALLWASVSDILGRVVRLEGEMDAGEDEEAAPAEGMRKERGESVRVVDEATIGSGDVFRDVGCGSTGDEIVRLTAERDAAIRDLDAEKKKCEMLREDAVSADIDIDALRSQRDAARCDAEKLKARVAELDGAAAARPMGWIARHEQSPPNGKYVMCRWDVSARQGYAREVGYGVAKRGPDGMWRAPNNVEKIAPTHWMPLIPGVEGGDSWEAPPVAATAANAGGEARQEDAIYRAGQFAASEAQKGPNFTERESGLRTELVTLEVTHDADDGHIKFRDWDDMLFNEGRNGIRFPGESVRVVEETRGGRLPDMVAWITAERDAARADAERLRDRVAELEQQIKLDDRWAAAASAANARGEAKQEPVAWGVLSAGEITQVSLLQWRDSSVSWSQRSGGTVVPLYALPVAESATTQPEPRGWLTAEEREAVSHFLRESENDAELFQHGGDAARVEALRALLARSSSPRVKVPMVGSTFHWIAAIREAGGEVEG